MNTVIFLVFLALPPVATARVDAVPESVHFEADLQPPDATGRYTAHAVLYRELPLLAVAVSGVLKSAEAKNRPFELRDDGYAPDMITNDGVYTAWLPRIDAPGCHEVVLRAQATGDTFEGVLRAEAAPSGGSRVVSRHKSPAFDLRLRLEFSPQDVTPPPTPAPVGALEATELTQERVTLTFRAPGNDLYEGRAARYEVRSSPRPIGSETDWLHAHAIPAPALPGPGGASDSIAITNLPSGEDVFIALRAVNGIGRAGPLTTICVRSPENR